MPRSAVAGRRSRLVRLRLDFDFARKQLITMCQDNGLLVLKFADGTWPFKESTASVNHN